MSDVAVERLVEELMECSDPDLDDRVRALELQRRRLEAEFVLAVGEVERRRSFLDDGHRSIKAYLRATCSHSDAEAARISRLSGATSAVPGLVEVLHAGHIGVPQANEVAVVHANVRVRDRLGEFAPILLELAERLSFREFRTCVQRFVMLADTDGTHRDVDESIGNRRAHVANLNGSLCLDAAGGDPLLNAELEAIFHRFCQLEYDTDVAARRAAHGDRADEHPLARTAAQRSYDAFAAIMRNALANHQADRPASATEPLVTILIDHRTWSAVLTEAGLAPDTTLAGETIDPFTGLTSPDDLLAELVADPDGLAARRCETSTGHVLHPHTVLRAALAGHIRRAVLGSNSVPIDLGRTTRVFTGPARQAAKLLAVQCDHLGCGLPADNCQIDHSTEWSNHGPTDQHNAGVECGTHNRLKHRKRWRTRRDIHGRTHTIRADGTIMLPAGTRPPTFPDEPPPPLTADIERALQRWIADAPDHSERSCRQLRAAAIRYAAPLDHLDLAALERQIATTAPWP
jgi:hypothetical protein